MSTAFMTSTPRATVELQIDCFADQRLFLPWEELTTEEKNEFDEHGSIPCEGGGVPGEWCANCRFGKIERD